MFRQNSLEQIPLAFGPRSEAFLRLWILLSLVLGPLTLSAQKVPEGIWQGYDGKWMRVSQQSIALAEATPAEKLAWRPAAGVRSTSEVYMHIAMANFYLLDITGPKMPAELKQDSEKTSSAKAEVIMWLKRSLDVVEDAHPGCKANGSRAQSPGCRPGCYG